MLTVAFLKRIEDILRAQTGGDASFRLSDYYDLIGGTSTGSTSRRGLALGMSVDEVRAPYFRLGEQVFKPGLFSLGISSQQYDAAKVAAALKGVFGDRSLGSSDFKASLLVMSKRLEARGHCGATRSGFRWQHRCRERCFGLRHLEKSPETAKSIAGWERILGSVSNANEN